MDINDFINSIDTKLYSRIRASKGDAECRRYLKEHLQKQGDIPVVSNSLQEHKQVIKDLVEAYIINIDDDGELKASITELMELSDRAVKLIKQ